MKTTKVQGAKVVEFLDLNDRECSMNLSSVFNKDPCIWLGIVQEKMEHAFTKELHYGGV